MRSSTRFIEWALLSAGTCSAFACSDREVGTPAVTARDQGALGQNLLPETEPNGTSATATAIGSDVVVRANVVPDGDNDFFRFNAPAGARVYAATMTGFSSASDVGTGDSVLDLIGTNGATVIETNDDQGTFGHYSSSISGASTAAMGAYFLRVGAFATEQLRPYDLHLRVLSGSPVAEVEPNNSLATATPLGNTRWASGQITTGDFDIYSLSLAAGDTVFASLDLDPERNGAWDGILEFGIFDGTTVYADDLEGISSEALFATVKSAGTYYLFVSPFAGTGTYQLSVGVRPGVAQGRDCVTHTSADAPKTIVDADRTTSVINVPGSPRIGDLDVSVQIAHGFVPDLDVHLRSPAGNDIALFTDVGVGSLDDVDLVIDDEAAIALSQADDDYSLWTDITALSGLIVQPETTSAGPLSSGSRLHWFDGENAGGTWTLVIDDDNANATAGASLASWSLTICEPAATRACSAGGSLVQAVNSNFNSGADGFTISAGGGNQWARGNPTAPAQMVGCNGGSQGCWKTNLAGPYAPNTTQNLVSPSINLTNAVAPITLSWATKYQLESASTDHAWVEVRDTAAARTDRVWEFLDSTMTEVVGSETIQETAGWGVHTADLSAYAGRTIQVAFHLDSNGAVQLGGFAVDDFSVSHCGCGDGVVAIGEQCDLGAQNGQPGRCCSASCTYVTNGTGCNDSSACTTGEVCTNGACGGGSPVTCDDGNVCTDNSCSPAMGCVYTPNTAPCPNGMCQAGMCQTGGGGAGGAGGGGGAGGAGAGGAGAGGAGAGGAGAGGAGAGAGGAGAGGVSGAGSGGVSGGAGAGAGGAAGGAGVAGAGPGGAGGANGGQSGGGQTGAGQAGSGGAAGAAQGGVAGQGGGAGTPPGGDAGEGGAPEGGAGQGATAGEGGEGAVGGEATGGGPRGGSTSGGRGGSAGSGTSGTSGDPGGGEGGEAVTDRNAKDIEADGTCGCRVPGGSKQSELPALLALALGAAAFRRRQRPKRN